VRPCADATPCSRHPIGDPGTEPSLAGGLRHCRWVGGDRARFGSRDDVDSADPHAGCPVPQGVAGDHLDHDLRHELDEDDPSARDLTKALKKQQLAEWDYADQDPSHYEEDHLISLELGGAPYSKKNLWPEPWPQAHKSDPRENAWHKKVCNGTLTLKQARDLEVAYKRMHG
jgi:hypothetical protein